MSDLASADKLASALSHLAETIDARAKGDETDKQSYTQKLLKDGPEICAKKLGEEGVETALAIALGQRDDIAAESADLLYHLFVGLRSQGVSLDDVANALIKRQGISGIEEKTGRRA